MNSTLFAKELRSNLFVTGVFFVVVALYVAMVVSMFDPELGKSLDLMMANMHELFAAFGMAQPASTLVDFMLNYLYGFLLTMFPFVLILLLVNKLMVRPLDRGTMSYLLATPNSRTRIAVTLIGVLVALLVLLMAATVVTELVCAQLMFPGDLDVEGLLRANAGLLCLWVFLAGMCFLSACVFSNAGAALWVGGGVGIVFFLMQMVAQLGDKLEFLKNVNPLFLFDGYALAAGDAAAYAHAGVLLALGAVFFAVAVAVFNRRNLSI